MDFDDEDLTPYEYSDDDETYTTSQKPKKAKKDPSTYTIRHTLSAPRATTYAAKALYDQMHSQEINLDAEYQRDVVWPDAKQISLIDSIYRNFYVPPVIFATKTHDDGSETKICIDGKQRLTSIRRFMDGLIPHRDPITMEKWWYKDDPTEKKARNVLPEKTRRIFEGKQIVCVEYQNITENDERDIFKRVQLGMALTPAEKLQVINTPRAAFIRDLQNEHVKDGGLSSAYLEWDSSRGGDFRCLAQALWCIEKYGPNLKNAGSISQLEKWLTSETELDEDFEEKATDTYRIFSELVQDPKLGKVFKKPTKVSPIEFILISLLIAVHRTSLSMGQLSSAIGTMRTLVRKEHVDIRMNNRVAKTMLDYIRTVKRSDFDQDSEPVAAAPAKGKGKTKAPAKPKSKRKRESGSNNESDEDYAEGPAKAKPKKSKPAPTPKKVPPPPPMKKEPPPSFPSLPSSSGSSRLAALRETARVSTPPSLPSLPTTSQTRQSSVSSNPPTPQLPSPGQRFTFPSSLSAVTGPQSHSVLQGQMQQQPYYSQQQPQHSPYTYNPTGGSGSTATANGYPAATRYVTGGQPPPNPPSRGNSYSGSGNWGSWR